MYDEKVEQEAQAMLCDLERDKLAVEGKLMAARTAIEETDQAIMSVRLFLQHYIRRYGLPTQTAAVSPVIESEYAHMGPMEIVEDWAKKQDGEVVVKELIRIGLASGLFKKHHNASSSIYSVVKRKHYNRLGPGRFKKVLVGFSVYRNHREPSGLPEE